MRFVLITVNFILSVTVFSQQVNERNLFQYQQVKEAYSKGSERHTAL